MQIILLDKVVNLGNLGDIVKVKDGYARNFLIPQRMAKRATPAALAEFEARRAELEKVAAEKLAAAQGVADKMAGLSVSVARKAGMDGRLFGSVGNSDIADALKAAGFEVDKFYDPHAGRSAQGDRRVPAGRRAAHRRAGQHHRGGCRRVIPARLTPKGLADAGPF